MKITIFSRTTINPWVYIYTLALALTLMITHCTKTNDFIRKQKPTTTRLTIIFVVDQLAYSYIQNLKPYFTGGLRLLIDQGVNYTNAYWPHATPATAVGHAGLNTGTFARYHGIVGNSWYSNGNKVLVEKKYLMIDGLTDQFLLAEKPKQNHYSYALSAKGRAAMMLAGKTGKALWLDFKKGLITSDSTYFEQMPHWVTDFNKKKNLQALPSITWKLTYPEKSPAYALAYATDYHHSSGTTLIDQTIAIDNTTEEPYRALYKNPYTDKLFLELAQHCIETVVTSPDDHLLLWMSLSSLDPVAHTFGPASREALDVIYQLDKNLQEFLNTVWRKFDKDQTLLALTADHGGMPLIENVKKKGYESAYRITPKDLIAHANNAVEKKYGPKNIVLYYKNSQLFLDKKQLAKLDSKKQATILKTIKRSLLKTPGIKTVWTAQELDAVSSYHTDAFKYNYAQQRYRGRDGHLFIQPQPYTLITKWQTGTAHKSPYNYDTHVPLIIYKPGYIEKKTITRKVWPLSLAPTLADIMGIPRPSAATGKILPGIFN
ncbi:alkaline phosphatase family protein [Methylicorpusculum sp.]|uniref:alkaline phosphatase family protein n=1 Tax=Methylicorpusculum sp. TaxID=2713644 RepID=UPI002AB93CCC|nr:alkaline phosphatase family protein [Methylicorpusculum sp.]MDZ4154644.1 alkaline phosphatase family protein [Methylicorpusculum sp.]